MSLVNFTHIIKFKNIIILLFIIMQNNNSYIKTDDNKIINEKSIKWIKKIDDCLYICTKSIGCKHNNIDTHKICKLNNIDSYNKLNTFFE